MPRPDSKQLREMVFSNLDLLVSKLNEALQGENLDSLKVTLERIGRGGALPHWFDSLQRNHSLPNLDGKTVGSVLEMLFVAVLEDFFQSNGKSLHLSVNPAKGVDIPDIELGVKSPSTNYCTSEPFFSAYERLLGGEYDVVVLLTDYQQAKKKHPLCLQIKDARYLHLTELADRNLCKIALKHRQYLLDSNEAWAKKVFRFFAFINQSDWLGKNLLRLVEAMDDEVMMVKLVEGFKVDFIKQNKKRDLQDRELIPDEACEALQNILKVVPIQTGLIDAVDNWIVQEQGDLARLPNDNEWNRFLKSPLNGKIGMSFALQWRYNFGALFRND